MTKIEAIQHDKSKWGEGPWMTEPDRKEWKDPVTGLPCLAVRNPLGNWCGYAGVPEGHKFYGVEYSCCPLGGDCPEKKHGNYCSHTPEAILNVHGGITYSGKCSGHICHTPEPGEPDNIWWFGFDAAHAFDHIPGMTEFRITMPSFSKIHEEDVYRDLPYIESEVASLASQLAAMTKLLPAPHETA